MTDVRRETIPLLWSAVRERASAKGFIFNIGIHSILVAADKQSLYLYNIRAMLINYKQFMLVAQLDSSVVNIL